MVSLRRSPTTPAAQRWLAPTNAGTYTVVATFPGDQDYTSASAQANFTINSEGTTTTITAPAVTYGQDGEVTVAVGAQGSFGGTPVGTVTLSVDGGTPISGTLSAAGYTFDVGILPAGPHSLSVGYSDPAGNYAVSSATGTLTVQQANAVISVSGNSGTYDGTAHAATGTANGVETSELLLAYSADGGQTFSSAAPVNAGTYEVYYTFTGDTNYNAINTETDSGQAVVLAKANAVISVSGYSVTYDGNSHTASGTALGINGAVLGGLDLSGTAYTNAGTYANETWTFSNPNYNSDSGIVSDSIAKTNAVISISGNSGTYDGQGHAATGTASGVESPNPGNLISELHLAYSSDGGHTFSTAVPVNASTYEVYYSFDGDTNYNAITTETDSGQTVTIGQAGSTVTLTLGSKFANGTINYDGQSHGVTASWASSSTDGNGGPLTVTYVGINSTHYDSTIAPTNAGTYEVSATFAGDTNHLGSNNSADFTIAQANAVIAVTGYSGTYDDNAHGATATATGVESPTPADLTSELHLAYSTDSGQTFSSAAPVNAGTYQVYYTFDGDTNYNAITTETDSHQTVTIGQTGSTVMLTLGSDFANGTVTYDGQAHGATAGWTSSDGAGGPLTVSYVGIDGTVYNTSTIAPTNAGTYEVSATFAGDTNHTVNSNTADFTISPLAVILTGDRNYDGTSTAAASILSITNAVGNDDVTLLSGSASACRQQCAGRSDLRSVGFGAGRNDGRQLHPHGSNRLGRDQSGRFVRDSELDGWHRHALRRQSAFGGGQLVQQRHRWRRHGVGCHLCRHRQHKLRPDDNGADECRHLPEPRRSSPAIPTTLPAPAPPTSRLPRPMP